MAKAAVRNDLQISFVFLQARIVNFSNFEMLDIQALGRRAALAQPERRNKTLIDGAAAGPRALPTN
jgi:hypothetical protein